MSQWREWAARFLPETAAAPAAEQWRAALAAAAGVLCVLWFSAHVLAAPLLVVAAIGASSALVFALPASPLAQPWSVIGSYAVSAVAGVIAAKLVPDIPLAAALAVGMSTLGMLALRCLHPPGGAVALFAVVGGEKVVALGFGYVLSPVLTNAVLLVGVALVVNNLLPGRHYPRRPAGANPHRVMDPEPLARLGLSHADLRAAIAGYNRSFYVGGEELDEIITLAERNAYRRRFGDLTCAEVMSKDVVSVAPDASLLETWNELRRHSISSVLVVNRARHVEGVVSLDDFVHSAQARTPGRLRQRLYLLLRRYTGGDGGVAAIMRRHPRLAHADTHVAELVPEMTRGLHQVPVVDAAGCLLGLVTQSDMIAALYHGRLAEDG